MIAPSTSQVRAVLAASPAQLNSLTKYPSILTLHALGERGRLTSVLTTPAIMGQPLLATEKIDGTSARLLVFADGSWVVGSREHLLAVSGDLLFDPAVGIVEGLRRQLFPAFATPTGLLPTLAYAPAAATPAPLTVIYGEFYGGKVTAQSKHYALPEQVGFRVFDVAVFAEADVLAQQLKAEARELATWRESETSIGLRYGQPFLPAAALTAYLTQVGLPAVPALPTVTLTEATVTLEQQLAWLHQQLPHTQAQLPGLATPGRAEGAILRTADRSSIVKIRFEDYERTLTPRGKG
jgi:hypothetical protein